MGEASPILQTLPSPRKICALRHRMVCQNVLEANQKCFSIASSNSSLTQVLTSATTEAAALLASLYLSAASRNPWANQAQKVSFFSLMVSLGCRHSRHQLPSDHSSHQLPLQWKFWTWPTQMSLAAWDAWEILLVMGAEDLTDTGLCQTFPDRPHYTLGQITSFRQPSPPADPNYNQPHAPQVW